MEPGLSQSSFLVGRKKKALFNYMKDRVWKKLNSWSGKALSSASREVRVKSVLQAFPNYCMSVFVLLSSLCDEIERMMNSFWWGTNSIGGRGIN